jgi:hypothetical protein
MQTVKATKKLHRRGFIGGCAADLLFNITARRCSPMFLPVNVGNLKTGGSRYLANATVQILRNINLKGYVEKCDYSSLRL